MQIQTLISSFINIFKDLDNFDIFSDLETDSIINNLFNEYKRNLKVKIKNK